jgi:hydrogenase nickel incorporation protein HypA/HybF
MHESSIAQAILDTALKGRPSGNARITRVNVVIGTLSGVDAECLRLYFNEITANTPAAGAELNVKTEPATLICRSCGRSTPYTSADMLQLTCPSCGGPHRLEGGNSMYIESVEVEEP